MTQTDTTNIFNLNAGQQNAEEVFFKFLFAPEKEMGISGPGGVGKTYLMRALIDQTMPRYLETCAIMGIDPKYEEVNMSALTNKATSVLAHHIGRPASTIHSLLGLTVKNDYGTGKTKLVRKNNCVPLHGKIIFIDEAFMTDTNLRNEILALTPNCKIIYVGDHCQLQPVGERVSPIYRDQSIKWAHLTEPMRNAGQPALINLCNQVRHTVETGEFLPIQMVPGVIDHLSDEQMATELEQVFSNQTMDSRVLAFTNQRVQAINDHIRLLRKLPDEFQIGELLVNNGAYHSNSGIIPVEEDVELLEIGERELIKLPYGADITIRRCSIRTGLGYTTDDVRVPVDWNHYQDLMKWYGKKKDWSTLFQLKETFADFRQRDAATFHKAQGSTYKSVFIDLGNLSSCNISDMVARMLYVGVSRAKERVYFFGSLASKYGSIIK